jgi:dolichol kinase
VFLADPAGAVFGKWMSAHFPKSNTRWIGQKTLMGSLAVFLASFVSLYKPHGLLNRLAVSALAMIAEAVGGSMDNLMIAVVVITFSGIFI